MRLKKYGTVCIWSSCFMSESCEYVGGVGVGCHAKKICFFFPLTFGLNAFILPALTSALLGSVKSALGVD